MARVIRFATTNNMFNAANTLFSLFVIYFIYLYSSAQQGSGWGFLATASKIYLILVVGAFLLGIFLVVANSIAGLSLWLGWLMRRR